MPNITWNWTEEGVEISNGVGEPKKFKRLTSKIDEVVEFLARFTTAREIYITLREAQAAYGAGQARYQGAVENLQHLLGEQMRASDMVATASREIAVFFEPAGLADVFGEDAESLVRFGQEAASKLKPK